MSRRINLELCYSCLFCAWHASTTVIVSPSIGKNQRDAPIYNMMGIEVSNTAARGLYIQNGRKYVVK